MSASSSGAILSQVSVTPKQMRNHIWEEYDLEGFLLLLAECGLIEAGVRVVHTDDEYNEHLGTVLQIDGDLARIVFKDGQEGWERLDSLYAATAKDVLRFA